MTKMILIFMTPMLTTLTSLGCATRAPTKFELDRRAGLLPEAEVREKLATTQDLKIQPPVDKRPQSPRRIGPRIEKIWVYDQELSPSAWMQGTYVFLEVEAGRWSTDDKGEVGP